MTEREERAWGTSLEVGYMLGGAGRGKDTEMMPLVRERVLCGRERVWDVFRGAKRHEAGTAGGGDHGCRCAAGFPCWGWGVRCLPLVAGVTQARCGILCPMTRAAGILAYGMRCMITGWMAGYREREAGYVPTLPIPGPGKALRIEYSGERWGMGR